MTTDRLIELRDLIQAAVDESERIRAAQLELIPAAKAAGASATELAGAFGISRAAFYKNGYAKIAAASSGDPAKRDELLGRISELAGGIRTLAGVARDDQITKWRGERDQLILDELAAATPPTWDRLAERAGVSLEWISRLKSR